MKRRESHTAISQRADVVLTARIAAVILLDQVKHGNIDRLLRRGHQCPSVVRQRDGLVSVNADGVLACRQHCLDRTVAGSARNRMHDVRALIHEGLRQLLTLGRIAPWVVAAHKRAGLLGCIPAQQFDLCLVLLVVVLDAGIHAVHKARHTRELRTAIGANLARLAVARCQIPGKH